MLQVFVDNPFGVLGVGRGATQGEVDRAARRARVMGGQGAEARGGGGVAEMERVSRGIERAVSQLAEPEERVRARVWWTGAGEGKLESLMREAAWVLRDKRRAVRRRRRWAGLLQRARAVAADGAVLAELERQEAAGGFEKAATREEVAEALREVPGRLAGVLVRLAGERMWERDDARLALRVLVMVGEEKEARDALLARLEDYLTRVMDRWKENVNRAWNTRKIAVMQPVCMRAVRVYGKVLAREIEALGRGGADADRRDRLKTAAGAYLDYLSKAYEAMYQYGTSRRVAKRAMVAARGTVREGQLEMRWKELRKQRWKLVRTPGGKKSAWRWGATVGVVVLLRMLVGLMGNEGAEQRGASPSVAPVVVPEVPKDFPTGAPGGGVPDSGAYDRWLRDHAGQER